MVVLALPAATIPEPSHSMRLVVRPDRSGRLVRSVAVSARPVRENVVSPRVIEPVTPAAETEPQVPAGNLREAIDQIARKHQVSPQLIHSVIRVESNYNPYAISSKGALGIMQLIPSTARRFGVANVFNPAQNIEGGARYLRYLLTLYGNNHSLALAAYNAGEAAVARYRGVPPFPETWNYLTQVARRLAEANAKLKREQAETKVKEAPPAGGYTPVVGVTGPDGKIYYISRKVL
jgi:soluble lytic murein transglycosylase-like protein